MAEVKILIEGFTSGDSGDGETCPTISLVKDEDLIIIVDPGVLPSQLLLAKVLANEGLEISDITHVFITHSHLDHYRNIGLFAEAKTIEYFGIWNKGFCDDRPENLSSDIKIISTPGHNYDSLSLLVKTNLGQVAIVGDVFWQESGPVIDPYASDQSRLEKSREQIKQLADYIIPGHGPMFKVNK